MYGRNADGFENKKHRKRNTEAREADPLASGRVRLGAGQLHAILGNVIKKAHLCRRCASSISVYYPQGIGHRYSYLLLFGMVLGLDDLQPEIEQQPVSERPRGYC